MKRLVWVFCLWFLLPALSAAQENPLLEILAGELQRNFTALKEKGNPQPYFMSYSVTEVESGTVTASLGSLQTNRRTRKRSLDVSVRVGSAELDNYHRVDGALPRFTSGAVFPLEEVPDAIRQVLWRETDRTYRAAAERLIKIRTSTQVKVEEEDSSADFSAEPQSVYLEKPGGLDFPGEDMAERARTWSALFAKYPGILTSSVTIVAERETKYLVTSEGSRLRHGRGLARIVITSLARAADGMDLLVTESIEQPTISELVVDERVESAIDRVARDIVRLLHAPVAEPFVGPAILSGRAAGVFFHEIFGHRIEGHRQRDQTEGQTFTKRVGEEVLPEFVSVVFDPTKSVFVGTHLAGSYSYDDEGVKAQRVPVVQNGILKSFLMSRSPISGFDHSNGHGRRQPGFEVVSRQSNLFVESEREVGERRLREMLIEEIQRQKKPYGLYFEQVTGGYTTTRRRGLQAFTVIPLVVYRVYPDGRPDELVRGVDIVGTPLTSFAKILATSDRPEVFNGYCGAESGNVPVAAASPALLISEIEIQKKDNSADRPPLLPRPLPNATAR